MTTVQELQHLPLFEGLPLEEVQWLLTHSTEERLQIGDEFYREGELNSRYYVVLKGELQITRNLRDRTIVLGTTPRGIMGGEVAILQGVPSGVTARAIMPTHLMVFELESFRQMFTYTPNFAARVMKVAGERMAGTATINVQQEKMAALGKLSAGLAHELNNPASAVRRAASNLQDNLHDLQIRTLKLAEIGMSNNQLRSLIAMQKDVIRNVAESPLLSPLEQADREEAIADFLDEIDVENSWEIAPVLANAALTRENVEQFVSILPQNAVSDILNWACVALTVSSLVDEMASGSERISELVKAVKSYTFMDRAPTQEVNINQNLLTTLKIMHHKLRDIEVLRELDPDLPLITGRGSELNQVFTNIIDNAADALTEHKHGQIEIITRSEGLFIMVEITDNGPGIPDDVMPHIFDPFFTTKDVGKGTGMGLELSYRIIQEHSGTIEARSEPGRTRFIIRLPIENNLSTG